MNTTTAAEPEPAPTEPGLPALPPARGLWPEIGRAVARTTAFARRASADQGDRPVPPLRRTAGALATVLADELFATIAYVGGGRADVDLDALRAELEDAVARLEAGGFLDNPGLVHPAPTAPRMTRLTTRRVRGLRFEHLSFPSMYRPPPGLPRSEQWLADEPNRSAHAYLLRHDGDSARPWVVMLHGHRMGRPLDARYLGSVFLHRALGVNVIEPVLPLHGPRGRERTVELFPNIDAVGNLYGLSQAVWDARRAVAWAREHGATEVGVCGVSLGGHTGALVASLEPGLACVIAGIPTVDFSTLMARHIGRYAGEEVVTASHVLDEASRRINRLVSPLAFRPLVPKVHRYIYAGVGDRLSTPEQAVELWDHWDRPEILWVQGSHIATPLARSTRRFMTDALRASGVATK